MVDQRFHHRTGPYSLAELARIAGGELAVGVSKERTFDDVGPLSTAGPDHVSFLDNKKYLEEFAVSKAGACVIHPDHADRAPQGMALILCQRPYRSYALIAQTFYPRTSVAPGIHPTAVIDDSAMVDPTAQVGPCAVIMAGAQVGARCSIGPNAVIGEQVQLGHDTTIGAGATVTHSLVGNFVAIYPGARIGQDGFGFAMDPSGHVRIPQVGRVVIEDHVEIGANTTIDRGAGPDTVICRGAMIDNLVQIGHNVTVGPGSVLVGLSGVSGSSRLGAGVVLAAQAGIAGHLDIGAGATIAAQSGVFRDVAAGESVCGAPAIPIRQFWRLQALLGRMLQGKGQKK